AAREARPRVRRARLGRLPPRLRAAGTRASRRPLPAAAEPRRRERRRDGRAARRRCARRLEAASTAARPGAAGDHGRALMQVAISGGAGFLGLHLARRLVANGHAVRTLDLAPLDDAELEESVEELRGDVRDAGAV